MKKYVPPKINPRRDKRYTTPILSVDLFEKAYPITEWDSEEFYAPEYAGHLKEGEASRAAVAGVYFLPRPCR